MSVCSRLKRKSSITPADELPSLKKPVVLVYKALRVGFCTLQNFYRISSLEVLRKMWLNTLFFRDTDAAKLGNRFSTMQRNVLRLLGLESGSRKMKAFCSFAKSGTGKPATWSHTLERQSLLSQSW